MRASRLSDLAYEHIKRMLIDGRAAAGTWFPIDEIASELGASRQPVMDAMKRLVLEGFVEIVPQVGCRVRNPEQQEIEDFFRFFASGEALIAELAAVRALPQDILTLQLMSSQIGEMVRMAKQGTDIGENYRLLNRRLHAELRRICRSPALSDIVESLGDRSDFYIGLSNRRLFSLNIDQAHREHESIIAAIAAHDAARARSAMEAHIIATEHRLLDVHAATAQA